MSIQIKKIHRERKRFLKTLSLNDPNEWLSDLAALKGVIALETHFQIVGHKVFFEISKNSEKPRLMLEVVGVPLALEHKTLELADWESCEVLIHKLDRDLFELDFAELLRIAKKLYHSLEKSQKSGTGLGDLFHIVYENEKIELHFFSQKDYIQKQI